VDADLFGSILKTFISMSGVDWTPDTICVFDGLEGVLERCTRWYDAQLSTQKVNEILREDAREHRVKNTREDTIVDGTTRTQSLGAESTANELRGPAMLPDGVEIIEAQPIVDRRSTFVGRACRITDPSQVKSSH